jgi:hypothetical protein
VPPADFLANVLVQVTGTGVYAALAWIWSRRRLAGLAGVPLAQDTRSKATWGTGVVMENFGRWASAAPRQARALTFSSPRLEKFAAARNPSSSWGVIAPARRMLERFAAFDATRR